MVSPKPTRINDDANFTDTPWAKDREKEKPAILEALRQNRELWQSKKIPNYRMEMSIVKGGLDTTAPEATIEVKDSKRAEIKRNPRYEMQTVSEYSYYDTVEKMHNWIEHETERGLAVNVKYDKELGYPREISFSILAIDGWRSIEVRKFEVLAQSDSSNTDP